MWQFTVNRAPSRWAAVHRMIAGAFSAADVTACAGLVSLCDVSPCRLLITRTRRPPLMLFAKKGGISSQPFSVVHTASGYQHLWCVNSCSHTAFLHRVSDVDGPLQTVLPFTLCGWGNHACSHLKEVFKNTHMLFGWTWSCHLLLKFLFLLSCWSGLLSVWG